MGTAAGVTAAVAGSSVEELKESLSELSKEDRAKVLAALDGPTALPAIEPVACLVPHELKGEWLPGVQEAEKALYEAFKEGGDMNMNPRNIADFRQMQYNPPNPETGESSFMPYDRMDLESYMTEKCDCETIKIDATVYGGNRKEMEITVNRVKGVEDKDRPAFIYFHGGAFVFGDAKRSQPDACFHAVNFNVTSFGVDYGVAPEVKAPDGGLNCYAAVKYICENYAQLNLDPKRIAIGGESAGGCHTAMCCYQLAKHSESHLVKFAWMDIAAVSNHWFDRTEENSYGWLEWESAEGQFGPLECLVKSDTPFDESIPPKEFSRKIAGEHRDDPEIFPVLMGDALACRCPPTYLTTREFDCYRRDCEEYAALMKKNKRLLMELYIQPGTTHMSGMNSMLPGMAELQEAWKTLFTHFMAQ